MPRNDEAAHILKAEPIGKACQRNARHRKINNNGLSCDPLGRILQVLF